MPEISSTGILRSIVFVGDVAIVVVGTGIAVDAVVVVVVNEIVERGTGAEVPFKRAEAVTNEAAGDDGETADDAEAEEEVGEDPNKTDERRVPPGETVVPVSVTPADAIGLVLVLFTVVEGDVENKEPDEVDGVSG